MGTTSNSGAQAQTMDTASFIASISDPRLRAEIMRGLDEATLNSLPPNLLAEAQNIQQ